MEEKLTEFEKMLRELEKNLFQKGRVILTTKIVKAVADNGKRGTIYKW